MRRHGQRSQADSLRVANVWCDTMPKSTAADRLLDAAAALAALADGRQPGRAAVLVGALALKTLCDCNPSPGRELLDAAAGLEVIATGDLDRHPAD